MLRRIGIFLVVVAIVVGFVWALWPKPMTVELATVGRRDITLAVEAEGKSRIREVFTISAPVAGQILRVNLHAGDTVKAGETQVATMTPARPSLLDARDRDVAMARRDAAKAAVELVASQLQEANATVGFAESEFKRAQKLVRQGTISTRTYEKVGLDLEAAKAAQKSMTAQAMVRASELQSVEVLLMDKAADPTNCCVDITTPVSGTILRVMTESEQVLAAGSPIMDVGNPSELEIAADLLSQDAVLVTAGATAVIEAWGGPALAAHVRRIEPSAVSKISALGIEEQRVSVLLDLDQGIASAPALGHGFRVMVRITTRVGKDLLAVPVAALFRRGTDWAVFVDDGERATERPITLGMMNDQFAEVVAGLASGDRVVLHPADTLEDGSRIRVQGPRP